MLPPPPPPCLQNELDSHVRCWVCAILVEAGYSHRGAVEGIPSREEGWTTFLQDARICVVPVLLQDKNQPFTDLRLLVDDNNLLQSTAVGACHARWALSTPFYRGGNRDFEKSPNLSKDVAKKWRQDFFQTTCFQALCSAHPSTPHLPCWSDLSSLWFLQWAFSEPLQPFFPRGCVECNGVCSGFWASHINCSPSCLGTAKDKSEL